MTGDAPLTRLVCAGCGASPPAWPGEPYPFRCPRASERDDIDHVLTRRLDTSRVRIDAGGGANPFLRYREILHSYHTARAHGVSDRAYCDTVERLSAGVERVDGRGLVGTPLVRSRALEERLGMSAGGAIWIKDETGNVSGSHKARHLMGLMLYLTVVERVAADGREPLAGSPPPARPELAMASCGNAALAAAVVARAAGWSLRVFVPRTAPPYVLGRLADLGAAIRVCDRDSTAAGDPTYLAFREAVRGGALPFCCQGSDNGLTIEGAETLVLEMVESLGGTPLDRLFVQVGGGALASACVQGFAEAHGMGLVGRRPRIHAVQTHAAFPLARAYERVVAGVRPASPGCRRGTAPADPAAVLRDRMRYARTHRSQFMWPWEEEPQSVARGILDDETYDWAAVLEGMLETGGQPVVVAEHELDAANAIAREATGIDADHTGTAGLAGLVHALAHEPSLRSERVAVIFSGARRPRSGGALPPAAAGRLP